MSTNQISLNDAVLISKRSYTDDGIITDIPIGWETNSNLDRDDIITVLESSGAKDRIIGSIVDKFGILAGAAFETSSIAEIIQAFDVQFDVVYHEASRTYVTVFAGTENDYNSALQDWYADSGFVTGSWRPQFAIAAEIGKVFSDLLLEKGVNGIGIGHSLGGGEAKIFGLVAGVKTISIDTPSTTRLLDNIDNYTSEMGLSTNFADPEVRLSLQYDHVNYLEDQSFISEWWSPDEYWESVIVKESPLTAQYLEERARIQGNFLKGLIDVGSFADLMEVLATNTFQLAKNAFGVAIGSHSLKVVITRDGSEAAFPEGFNGLEYDGSSTLGGLRAWGGFGEQRSGLGNLNN